MISPFRILEILACSLASFLPFVLLMTYPFRNNLRATGFLVTLATMVQMGLDLAIGLGILDHTAPVTLIVLGVYILLSLILIRAGFGRKVFCILTTVNSAVAISLAAKYLEQMIFGTQELAYHWTYLAVLLALEAVILIPFGLILMHRHVRVSSGHVAPWGVLWLVPALVFAAWVYMSLYGLPGLPVELLMIGLTVLSCLVTLPFIRKPKAAPAEAVPLIQPEVAAIFGEEPAAEEIPSPAPMVEDIPESEPTPVAEAIPEPQPESVPAAHPIIQETAAELKADNADAQPSAQKNAPAERKSRKLPMRMARHTDFVSQTQLLQQGHLAERISQSNQFHRELRRHIDAMAYRLEKKQYDKLQAHLSALQQQFSSEEQTSYCENSGVNTILAYFTQMAGYCGCRVTADVHLEDGIPVKSEDLNVLIGNLLDNALDACKRQSSSDRRIFISAWAEEKGLYLTVENTYEGMIRKDPKGSYLSSKHAGFGMGLEVCSAIAARYDGALDISDGNGIFKVKATLKF